MISFRLGGGGKSLAASSIAQGSGSEYTTIELDTLAGSILSNNGAMVNLDNVVVWIVM